MSLRRRPIDTATYIPRGATAASAAENDEYDTGFSLTSTGAIGFSDDIERKLSSMSMSTAASASAAAPSGTAAASSPAGISCNRDILSNIKPYYSRMAMLQQQEQEQEQMLPTASAVQGFSDDDLLMMLGKELTAYPPKQLKQLREAASIVKKDQYFNKGNVVISQDNEIAIQDAYVEYTTKGKYKTVNQLIAAKQKGETQAEIPQRIFRVYQKLTARLNNEKGKQVKKISQLLLLANLYHNNEKGKQVREISQLLHIFRICTVCRHSHMLAACQCSPKPCASARFRDGTTCTSTCSSNAGWQSTAGKTQG